MAKYNDKTGSMTGAPNMAQLMAMSKKENDKRIKQMQGVMKIPMNQVNTKTSNSTLMFKKKTK